jgi:hypothetical protein
LDGEPVLVALYAEWTPLPPGRFSKGDKVDKSDNRD